MLSAVAGRRSEVAELPISYKIFYEEFYLMAKISYSNTGSNPFRRILGHNPELLQAFEVLDKAIQNKLSLPYELREEVRRVLAHGRGSQY